MSITGDVNSVVKDLSKIKQIVSISITVGSCDLLCSAIFRDLEELLKVIALIKKDMEVKSVLMAQEIEVFNQDTHLPLNLVSQLVCNN